MTGRAATPDPGSPPSESTQPRAQEAVTGGLPASGLGLALDGIVKRFGGAVALDGASLLVPAGTLHAVLGENGAGKTTLMRIAFGLVRPDAGTVRVHGGVQRFGSPAEAIKAGVGMVHQHFTIVPAMTVAENVALGGRGPYRARQAAALVEAVGASTGLKLDPAARAGDLPVAAQQRLEIVKALARAARILILDEPGAVLSPAEAEDLLSWLRGWVDGGEPGAPRSAVLVTHKLQDALRYADAVTVVRRGRTVLAAPSRGLTESELALAMLGGQGPGAESAEPGDVGAAGVSAVPGPEAQRVPGPVVVRATGVYAVDGRGVERVRNATFSIRAGELVGVAAVEGSGQHELLRLLAGRLAPSAGSLESPADVGFVPEDRQGDALLLEGSLAENVTLRGAGTRRGRVNWRTVAARVSALLEEFDVRGGGVSSRADALSGGNQQKLVVAREIDDGDVMRTLVVAENPTRGLDIRAAGAVRARLQGVRDAGAAVVVYSSDLEEVLALADRVLVVHRGEVHAVPADAGVVGRTMLGLEAGPISSR